MNERTSESRRCLVAVIGAGTVETGGAVEQAAFETGLAVVDAGFRLVTGGLGGVMEAASRGARSSPRYHEGDILGILPGLDPEEANPFVDVVLATGLGDARNLILANSDGVVAVGGGAGTLLEMAAAWKRRALLAAVDVPGWSRELGGRKLDERREGPIRLFETAAEAVAWLASALSCDRSS
jgi:uncharacterized protein (TIGR00725 family)